MAAAGSAGRPHRRKERIPPGPAAIAAAEALRRGTSQPNMTTSECGRNTRLQRPSTVIDLSTYERAARGRNTLDMTTTPMPPMRLPAPNTAEAASLYQRLRGHLAVLKLHDAAEALPAVLDRAQTDQPVDDRHPGGVALDRGRCYRGPPTCRAIAVRVPADPSVARGLRLRRRPGPRPEVDRRARDLPLPRNRDEYPADRPAGGRQDTPRRSGWRGPRCTPATAPTSPPPPTSPPAATGPRSRAGGRRRCGSSPAPPCLVIDELGYLPLPGEAASALFQVVAQRYLKTSIIMTTNRSVGEWGEVLGDTTVAAAMLDRLLHRSVVLNLDGDSYRLRDHHARAENLRKATTATRQPLQ